MGLKFLELLLESISRNYWLKSYKGMVPVRLNCAGHWPAVSSTENELIGILDYIISLL